jgi:two-component system response regulator PilR (NtrC family)
MSQQTVLVIDDERDIRELLTITLGRMDLKVDAVGTVAEARHALTEHQYDLCFTDMRLPDGSGQEVIELIAAQYDETPVAMITAYGNVDAAVTALKAGAFDFVSKPVDIQMLRRLVRAETCGRKAHRRQSQQRGRWRQQSPDRRFERHATSAQHHRQAGPQPGAGLHRR